MAKRKVAEERGRIKTGFLSDVRSIGGFIQAQNGQRYAVYADPVNADEYGVIPAETTTAE